LAKVSSNSGICLYFGLQGYLELYFLKKVCLTFFITTYEIYIRLSFFFGILILMAIWEMLAHKRALTTSKLLRWLNNLGLVVLNSLILRWLFPAATTACWASKYDDWYSSI